MQGKSAAAKSAELASGLGAIVFGAGLALVLPDWLRAYALPLLVGGVLVQGAGMTLKCRLENHEGPPLWWERALLLGLLGRTCTLARRRLRHGSVVRPLTFRPWEGRIFSNESRRA